MVISLNIIINIFFNYNIEEFYIEEDDNWIENIETEDDLYNDFYLEKNDNITLTILYVNKFNNIENIKKEKYFLNEQMILKADLLYLLKTKSIHQNIKYSLLSIIQYNIDLLPEDVRDYLLNSKKYNFFKLCKTLDDIKWKDTINLFKDINNLYLIYYEKRNRNNTTKKVFLSKSKKKKNITRKKI